MRRRFHPELAQRVAQTAAGLAGVPGTVYSLVRDLGVVRDAPADGIEAGFEAGDVLVQFDGGSYSEVVLRRREVGGLAVVRAFAADRRPAYARSTSPLAPVGLHEGDTVFGGAAP